MNILTCALEDSLSNIEECCVSCALEDSLRNIEECCVCEKKIHIGHALAYVVTKSDLFVCRDCLDRLVRENKRKG